jgi:hypothetical protein
VQSCSGLVERLPTLPNQFCSCLVDSCCDLLVQSDFFVKLTMAG